MTVEETYTTLYPRVVSYIKKHYPSEDAHDVASEAFLRLVKANPEDRGVYSWLAATARNMIIDRARRRRGAVMEDLKETTAVVYDSPDESVYVEQLLSGLSPNHQKVLRMRFLQDLSVEDTAARLGLAPDATKKLQRRALGAARRAS